MAALLDRAAAALEGLGAAPSPAWTTWFVPGRLEVLGKHTDYAGGRSLLCAVERGFCIIASPRDDSQLRIVDAATTSVVSFEIDADLGPPGGWANYPATVARRVARNFCATRGADIAFESDLPQAAGMSSSSALLPLSQPTLQMTNKSTSYTRPLSRLRRMQASPAWGPSTSNSTTNSLPSKQRALTARISSGACHPGSPDPGLPRAGGPPRAVQLQSCPPRAQRYAPA